MGPCLRLVAAVLVLTQAGQQVRGCNVRDVADYMQSQFREGGASGCGELGTKCSFDRQCCKGLECKLSASKNGVESICQPWVYGPKKGSENIPVPGSAASEPWTDDELWMVDRPDLRSSEGTDVEEKEENKNDFWKEVGEGAHAGTIAEIEKLQERKRVKLLRENEALEKLFTEKDQKELEQLRALKEDAEMDELRKLKELKLRRKLELIKELRELRDLKAKEDLDRFYDESNKTESVEDEKNNVSVSKENITETSQNNNTRETSAEKKETEYLEQAPIESQKVPEAVDALEVEPNTETESSVPKYEDGTHKEGLHHKRKHHQKHKKRTSHTADKLQPVDDQTMATEDTKNENQNLETNIDENYQANQTET